MNPECGLVNRGTLLERRQKMVQSQVSRVDTVATSWSALVLTFPPFILTTRPPAFLKKYFIFILIVSFVIATIAFRGFPGGTSGKEPTCQCRRQRDVGLIPGSGRFPWRTAQQPTPVFLPGKSHGQMSLMGYSPWGHTVLDITEVTQHAPLLLYVFFSSLYHIDIHLCVTKTFFNS